MRVLCVGRHLFLSAHFERYFSATGVIARGVVGMDRAAAEARSFDPDVVVCDYELLSSTPLDEWEADATLARVPVIAVSLTRRSNEANMLDLNGISGYLYLPTLNRADVLRVLRGAAPRRVASPVSLEWSPSVPTTRAPAPPQ